MVEVDYYEILDVAPTASIEEIKAAYYRAVRTAHPDAGGTAGMFRVVSEAYRTLADPRARAVYDARSGFVTATEAANPSAAPDTHTPPEAEWGEEFSWNVDADEDATIRQPDIGSTNREYVVDRLFGAFDRWMVRGSGRLTIRWASAAAAGVFVFLVYVLFAHPGWIRPEAAGSDALGDLLANSAVLRIMVFVYAIVAIGGFIGLLWIPLAAIHLTVVVGIITWLPAYWGIAGADERLSFLGVGLLWFTYFLVMTVVPLIRGARVDTTP